MKISLMQFNLSKLSKILCLIFNLLLDRHTNKHKQTYFFKGHEWVWSFNTRVLAAKYAIHSLRKLLSSTSASQHLNHPI